MSEWQTWVANGERVSICLGVDLRSLGWKMCFRRSWSKLPCEGWGSILDASGFFFFSQLTAEKESQLLTHCLFRHSSRTKPCMVQQHCHFSAGHFCWIYLIRFLHGVCSPKIQIIKPHDFLYVINVSKIAVAELIVSLVIAISVMNCFFSEWLGLWNNFLKLVSVEYIFGED